MSAHFTLAPAGDPRLLGLWAETTVPSDMAFSAAEAVVPAEATWRIDLPDDAAAATTFLATARRQLDRTRQGLAGAPERLTGWLARDDWDLPEIDAAVAFGIGDEGWRRQIREALDAVALYVRSLAPTAWVETNSGERVVARSRITLTGRMSTLVVNAGEQHMAFHHDALVLTSATRIAALQSAALTVRAAVAIAARLALPGGPLLTLPLAWRFLQRITDVTRHQPEEVGLHGRRVSR